MTALDVARWFSGLMWIVALVFLTSSMWRNVFGAPRPFDKVWSLFWIIAAHQIGYFVRYVNDLSHVPTRGEDFYSLVGLHVLGSMVAFTVLTQRRFLEGRWF